MSDTFSPRAPLVDRFGRRVSYLRLSVTDRCDFRCLYCMEPNQRFAPRDAVLRLEELLAVARAFVALGVTKVRLTGGEPLVRPNILWLMEKIHATECRVITTRSTSDPSDFPTKKKHPAEHLFSLGPRSPVPEVASPRTEPSIEFEHHARRIRSYVRYLFSSCSSGRSLRQTSFLSPALSYGSL